MEKIIAVVAKDKKKEANLKKMSELLTTNHLEKFLSIIDELKALKGSKNEDR